MGTIGEWPSAMPKLDSDFYIPTHREFRSEDSPRKVMTRLIQITKRLGGKTTVDRTNYVLEATLQFKGCQPIQFQVELRDSGDDISLVTFRRISGNQLLFAKCYEESFVNGMLTMML